MTHSSVLFRCVSVLALLFICGRSPAATTTGIFADFTTSMGSFTCRLDHAVAPKAVANFIGLATGQRAWLDSAGNARTNPFYNGLTFHRVIDKFMIQGGSRNGMGTDGPGYAFVDEFNASARFTGTGVLAMANSGPDSNGAQFFITAGPTPHLNDLHTIFGRVTFGTNVVLAISKVATGAASKPLTNVVIQDVRIRRVGAAAEAFDIHNQGLPIATNLPLSIGLASNVFELSYSNRLHADNRLYVSTNLQQWSERELGIEVTTPTTNSVVYTNAARMEFFKFAQVRYASSTFSPKNLYGRQLTVFMSGGGPIITNIFDSVGKGTYAYGTNRGEIVSYTYGQEPYRARLWPIEYTELIPMTLRLDFATLTNGTFSGTAYPAGPSFAVSGTFRLK